MTNRLAQLQVEIDTRDRKIDELERQIAVKDMIIRKQGVIISQLQEDENNDGA